MSALPLLVACIATVLVPSGLGTQSAGEHDLPVRQVEADLLVVGGTESGCAATIQAARMGVSSVVLVNDIDWLGGQFSAEGLVAIDENAEQTGSHPGVRHRLPIPRSGLFKQVADRIETVNLEKYGSRRPGNTRVITTCRPKDAADVFRKMLQPYIDSGQLKVESHYAPAAAEWSDDRAVLTGIRFQPLKPGLPVLHVRARLTIDASDWGEAIRLSGADYEFGPDLRSKYQEPLAPQSRERYPPTDMNPITYTMVLVETDRYEPISRPAGYDPARYRDLPYPRDLEFLYTSPRVIDRYGNDNVTHPDVILLCYPGQDYPLDVLPGAVVEALEADEPGASKKNVVEMTRRQREAVFDDAKRHSLGFLYYLQTEFHENLPDKTHSFRRFALTDEFGTNDRLPWKPYVRESLRLKAMYMMRQQDTTGHGNQSRNFARVMYHDAVACWQFEYDYHPTGRRFVDGSDRHGLWQAYFKPGRTWGPPYSGRAQFPMRSLIPEKIDGLLAAQKNLGYSSLVSSAVRLHDVSMAVGQASGATAAVSLLHNVAPRCIPFNMSLLEEVRAGLCAESNEAEPLVLWPFRDLETGHPAFVAVNRLAARQGLPIGPTETDFRADAPADPDWRAAVIARSLATITASPPPPAPEGRMTRGEYVRRWWELLEHLPLRPAAPVAAGDADGDGIADSDDPSPLDGNNDNLMDHLTVPL